MKKITAALGLCLSLVPLSSLANTNVSVNDTTMSEMRDLAEQKVMDMQEEYARYGASSDRQESGMLFETIYFKRNMNRFFRGPEKVGSPERFQMQALLSLSFHLNRIQKAVQDEFKHQRSLHCDPLTSVSEMRDGNIVKVESYVGRSETSVEKQAIFCTVNVPTFLPFNSLHGL